MAEISAKLVMELRKKTGAGMMECKKALVSANGDFDEAIKVLREKGVAVAAKKADRIAAEGIVDTLTVDGVTAMVEVNAETDFVAKNASFREFVQGVLRTIVANKPATNEELMALPFDGTEMTVEGALKDKIFTIGENMSIRRFVIVEGACGSYIHGNGAIACVTKFDTENVDVNGEAFAEFAKNICMQIVAMTPAYVCRHCVPESVLANEKEIALTQINNDPKNASKPENIKEKMIEGRINKFFESACLVDQGYVKEDKITVGQYTENTAKELGGSIKSNSFVKFERGEGLEKKEEDFASEIEKLVNG